MSSSSSAQVRTSSPAAAGSMKHSASFAAHLKTLARSVPLRGRYENFIGGQWVAPAKGGYFDNISPTTGQVICQIARSQAEDVELAIDAGHAAADKWGRTSVTDRARILNRIADRMEEYLPFLAEQAPLCIMLLRELIQDLLPPGVLNGVNGFGLEAGKPLASSSRIAKIAFTGETTTGRLIMQYASENIIPVTLELGGKSPNIFFADVMREDDEFVDKALEGFAMFALNQGEVCTCPSRALVQRSIYERFMEKAVKRVASIRQGDPFEMSTQIGAQASNDQFEKILSYIDIGKKEGAKVLTGGSANKLPGELAGGYYIKPTVFEGHNKMRIFQEEIFGPVVSVTSFDTPEQALEIANDTLYGLGSGVWTRDLNMAYRFGRGIKAGRVWTNCFHAYPAHAAFGGYKKSGIGRETHKMMLDHYQQTKNVLVSYSTKALGFF